MTTRIERDTFGPIEVPAVRLWGAQTQRSLQHFHISTERMPREIVVALAQIKRAAAKVNGELGLVPNDMARAIQAAATEVASGLHEAEFPLSVWQTGSGTQTNMNVNEVLANRASELLGGERGERRLVHPNDHVNRGQSSNDVFPTAMHLAGAIELEHRVLPALHGLQRTLADKREAFAGIVKIGRTHLQDATPITLGQEISGWVAQLTRAAGVIRAAGAGLLELAIGGTAVGTGIGTPPTFGARVASELATETGLAFVSASNKFEALASHDAMVTAHGALRSAAVALIKIANDVRWLASGPRAGLGELSIPENEPGSSIMPGKVNPTQCEALTMACTQVLGNDAAVGFAGASGNFELNVYKPMIAQAFLQSARLVCGATLSFEEHCARGIEPNVARIDELMRRSLMLVTALVPHIGYDRAAAIAKDAHAKGTSLREAAIASGAVAADDFDRWVDPTSMVGGA